MIRRRKARQHASASPDLAIPKSPHGTRRQQADAAARAYTVARKAVRLAVFQRDMGCRARCGSHAEFWVTQAHVHEEPPRSAGGNPLDPADCLWLCPTCHAARHPKLAGGGRQRLFIRYHDPVRKAAGPVEFQEGTRVWVTQPHRLPSAEEV